MSSFTPFLVRLFWGGRISFANGVVTGDESTFQSSFIVYSDSITYPELVETVCNHVQVDRESVKLTMVLYYMYMGNPVTSYLYGDDGVRMLCFLASSQPNFIANISVTWDHISLAPTIGMMELMRSFSVAQQSTQTNMENLNTEEISGDERDGGFPNSEDDQNAGETEDSEVPPSDNESADEVIVTQAADQYNSGIYPGFATGPVESYDEAVELRDSELPDFDDEDSMDAYNPDSNVIRVGMFFKSKGEVTRAIRRWNVECNRELIVTESRPTVWRAKCYTTSEKFIQSQMNSPPCCWYASACLKRNKHMWQLTKWVAAHNCYGTVSRNNNRCLRSEDIAAHISRQIQTDISFPVKQVRAYIKDTLHVDITYSKAWFARRRAIESIYGSWDSNFNELPSYIRELQHSNNGTVVAMLNGEAPICRPTFKYIFWAFKPSIDAFRLCQPVISVDGTHLKGPYRSKLLIAVSKNANNYILPVAYAIVDEETIESWCWFFNQFRHLVLGDTTKKMCVISDRHKGIIYAMNNLPEWKEPNAFHRFCLRHVRSNLMTKFKSACLKKICWAIGSTTQKRKYRTAVSEMRAINEDAWTYLDKIEKSQWTLYHDSGRRRWGNLTTNISESMNNALRQARLLPITALINYTFTKDVAQYAKHAEIASTCNTALPPRMWRVFNNRDRRAQDHEVFVYDHLEQRYRVTSRYETNDTGGNDYTVEYVKKKCSCRKWQTERFPCSHAIAVCRFRDDEPHDIVNRAFHTATYREQYSGHYYPLRHKDMWTDGGWKINGDPSKISTLRGRRRARRIRNEMDVNYADEPRKYKCGLCKEQGHRRNQCPYRNQ